MGKGSKQAKLKAAEPEAKPSTAVEQAAPAPDTADNAPSEPQTKRWSTQIIGSASLFSASLSSLHGIENYDIQSHVFAFAISIVLALVLGLSPGLKQLLERWTFKRPAVAVDYKKAIIGLGLVLAPLYFTFGALGPSGAWTVANLAVAVTSLA